MLLKQGKISYEYRKHALNALGSFAEQESYFIEYEMYEDLINFYLKHHRHEDRFVLLVKLYRLEDALHLWFEQHSTGSVAGIPEDDVLNILDYVCAGMIISASSERLMAEVFKESDSILLPNIARKVQQWMAASRYIMQNSTALDDTAMESMDLRAFLSVQVSDLNVLAYVKIVSLTAAGDY